MSGHRIVSQQEWVEARKALLAREKQFTRERDALSAARRELPWVRVEKTYDFATESGRATLGDLFGSASQLAVYHFMFDPTWDAGCKSCSWWADNFERNVVHLRHRDVSLVAISLAPLAKLVAYKQRMGWTFPWVSSFDSDFNHDFGVSWTKEEIARGEAVYNFAPSDWEGESPGISIFAKEGDAIFRTYSCYSRGLDMMNAGYHWLDLMPKGRDEASGMAWLRRRDEYKD